ncbi:RHS repeat-associated core domain-containing protein, partial [Cronobacter dublinensis]
QSDREPDHYVQYVYTEGSYEPLARVDSVFDDCEIYWYHTELNGLPERVTDADGQTVWRGQFSTWGKTERELSVPQWQVPQNLRFQGQYLDRESGLHYNLFRYYDPVAGRYTQMDPIGLLGGINTYGYVPDPLTWVDPLGLTCGLAKQGEDLYVGTYGQVRGGNLRSGLNPTHTPHHAIQNAASPTTHSRGITINLRKDLHELTWTFKKPMVPGLTNREYLARDIVDLRKILRNAGYDKDIVNRQLNELIRQNKELWKTLEI